MSSLAIEVADRPPPPSRPRPRPASLAGSADSDDSLPDKPKRKWGVSKSAKHARKTRHSTCSSQASDVTDISIAESDAASDDSTVLGEDVPESSQLYTARLLMSLFATVLLWCTTLNLVTSIIQLESVIPLPDLRDDVVDGIWALINYTYDSRDTYVDCVATDLFYCNRSLHNNLASERARVAVAAAGNVAQVQGALDAATACATAHATALASVQAWQQVTSVGNDSQYVPSASCSAADIEALKGSTGDRTAQRDATMNMVVGYADLSNETLALLAGRMIARAEYDSAYMDNKTAELLGKEALIAALSADLAASIRAPLLDIDAAEFINCASLTPSLTTPLNDSVCPYGSALNAVDVAQQQLYAAYDASALQYQQATERLQVLNDAAEAKVQEYRQIWEQLDTLAAEGFSDLGVAGIGDLAAQLGYSLGTPSFDLGVSIADVDVLLPDAPIITLDSSGLEQYAEDLERSVDRAVDSAVEQAEKAAEELAAVDLAVLGDYDPPPITADCSDGSGETCHAAPAEVGAHEQATEQFVSDVAVSLNALDDLPQGDAADGYSPALSTSNFSVEVQSSFDLGWFTFKEFEEQAFPYEDILSFLSWITSFFIGFDYLWRTLRTVSILRRFWSRSSLEVAPIDMQTDDLTKGAAVRRASPLQATAMLVTHPLVLGAVFVGFLVIVVAGAAAIYYPFFDAYREGCAKTAINEAGEEVMAAAGTILVKNVYSIAFNYAAYAGNRDRLTGMDAYETERLTACAANGQSSNTDQERLQADLSATVAAHARTAAEVERMSRCYDLELMDQDFAAGLVLDVTGSPYPPLSQTLAEPACAASLSNSSLDDGVFACAALPLCEVYCDDLADEQGNDNTLLRSYALKAMCTAEYYVHAVVLRICFAAVIYLFINLGRAVAVMGCNRLMWRWLNTGVFSFLGSADAKGHVAVDEEELGRKIQAGLRRMQARGAALLCVSAALQLVWLVPLVTYLPDISASLANLQLISVGE